MLTLCENDRGHSMGRRAFLRAGFLGLAGLSLADSLRLQAAGVRKKNTAVIFVWIGGGISQIDTYDMKPTAPAEIRSEFKEIDTNVRGIRVCEHLPFQAKIMDKLSLIRTINYEEPAHHGMCSHFLLTGQRLLSLTQDNAVIHKNPMFGSVAAKLRGANQPGVPANVIVPKPGVQFYGPSAAYLGSAYNPFSPEGDPNGSSFQVRDFRRAEEVTVARLDDRRKLMERFNGLRRDLAKRDRSGQMDPFYRDAFEMVSSDRCLNAFDLTREDPRTRDRYGRTTLGQSLLLARRLVESGVTFVSVNAVINGQYALNGWDTHYTNFPALKHDLLPPYDRGLAALIEDIYGRGLDKDVLVLAFSEFGRTPKINDGIGIGLPGRDHWTHAMTAVVSGGGIKTGQAIGATTAKGEMPKTRPIPPADLLATMYQHLGIDPSHEFHDTNNRPIPILYGGEPIKELF